MEIQAPRQLVAKQQMDIEDAETAQKIMDFIDALEEDEDVSDVHTNANISSEIAAQVS